MVFKLEKFLNECYEVLLRWGSEDSFYIRSKSAFIRSLFNGTNAAEEALKGHGN